MRIVASACLVLAILFMVGCGTSAEDKKMIQENATKIQNIEKDMTAAKAAMADFTKKITDIETFLKDNKSAFGKYGAVPDTTKTKIEAAGKKGGEKPPKTETPAEKPKGKKPEPSKSTGTGKGGN